MNKIDIRVQPTIVVEINHEYDDHFEFTINDGVDVTLKNGDSCVGDIVEIHSDNFKIKDAESDDERILTVYYKDIDDIYEG
jgi:hypothetical protein